MRILLSGATGFIGSHVARSLVARGDDVVALTRSGSDRRRLSDLPGSVTWLEVDPLDAGALREAARVAAPDTAVLLAWYAEPGRYLRAVPENFRSLAAGILLLDALAAASCPRIVVVGTCLENQPATTVYAACKAAMHAATAGLRTAGVQTTCAHVFYPYGPWEDPGRAIPLVIAALLRNEAIAVGEGLEERDYLHVADVAEAICRLARGQAAETVDICTGQPVALREVFAQIGLEIGRPELIGFGERAPQNTGFPATGDPVGLLSTGWRPRFDLRSGLRDTIAFWSART